MYSNLAVKKLRQGAWVFPPPMQHQPRLVGEFAGGESELGVLGEGIAGCAVEVDGEAEGGGGRHALGEEGGGDAGEYVAHAGRAHAGVAGVVDEYLFAVGAEAVRAFEYYRAAEELGELLYGGAAVGLYGGNAAPQQAGGFAGVGGEKRWGGALSELGA